MYNTPALTARRLVGQSFKSGRVICRELLIDTDVRACLVNLPSWAYTIKDIKLLGHDYSSSVAVMGLSILSVWRQVLDVGQR